MKNRFRKALFAFFKDEILNSVGYNGSSQTSTIMVTEERVKFTEIKAEILLDNRGGQMGHGEPTVIAYERALEDCKQRLFDESMKSIRIDEQSIMDSHIYDGRAIRVSLLVGRAER